MTLFWVALILYVCGWRIKRYAKQLEAAEAAHGVHFPREWSMQADSRNGGSPDEIAWGNDTTRRLVVS